LFLYFHCPNGKLKDISIIGSNNAIKSYKINDKRVILSEIFPTLSSVSLDKLPLYVGINKKMGGKNNKSRKNDNIKKNIKTRKVRK